MIIHTHKHQEKSTEINKNRNRYSYCWQECELFNFHWETFLTIPVKFTKAYILFPVILNLGMIIQYFYIHEWNMHKFIYCNIVSDKTMWVKSIYCLKPAMVLAFHSKNYSSIASGCSLVFSSSSTILPSLTVL